MILNLSFCDMIMSSNGVHNLINWAHTVSGIALAKSSALHFFYMFNDTVDMESPNSNGLVKGILNSSKI